MRKLLFFVSLFALFGCKPGAGKAIELAQKEISSSMRDPDSAKFRYVRFIKLEEKDDGAVVGYVCGHVNAKNGFGAYGGFTPFLLKISMEEKGMFSKGVNYLIEDKEFVTESNPFNVSRYAKTCGPDE